MHFVLLNFMEAGSEMSYLSFFNIHSKVVDHLQLQKNITICYFSVKGARADYLVCLEN